MMSSGRVGVRHFIFLLFPVMVGCGGGSEGNDPPTADAGVDQIAQAGQLITLDGTGSSDEDGRIVRYAWMQTQGPDVSLSGSDSVRAKFSAPSVVGPTILVFRLTVTDNDGASDTDTVRVNVDADIPGNDIPRADAGADQTITSGRQVTLDGRGSSDADGTLVSYAWTQMTGEAVSLTGADTAQATFTAPIVASAAALTFQLTVTDDQGATGVDTVQVNVIPSVPINVAPQADAGPDQTVTAGQQVTLDGSASSDPDGTIAAYAWVQTMGQMVSITGSDAAQATFQAPTVTSVTALAFQLTVTDDNGATGTDLVQVNVVPAMRTFLFGMKGDTTAALDFIATTSNSQAVDLILNELKLPNNQRYLHIDGAIGHGNQGNLDWSWHFIPDEWMPAEMSVEVCDGRPTDVESDLSYWVDKLGHFCPWASYVKAEVTK